MQRRGFLVIAAILLGGVVAPAQAAPCALICFPPAVLDAKACTCAQPIVRKAPLCSLVCLDPDQTLDAKKCACVRRPR